MICITEIAFTGYPVTDIVRARAFYEGTLQLKPTKIFEGEGHYWIEYDVGPNTVAISNFAPEWKPSVDGPSIAFEVANFDEAISVLRAASVKFVLEPTASPACRMAVVGDPDGNLVTIHKRNAG